MRLGGGDRTKEIPIAEWERVFQKRSTSSPIDVSSKGARLGQREKALLRSQILLMQGREASCTLSRLKAKYSSAGMGPEFRSIVPVHVDHRHIE